MSEMKKIELDEYTKGFVSIYGGGTVKIVQQVDGEARQAVFLTVEDLEELLKEMKK